MLCGRGLSSSRTVARLCLQKGRSLRFSLSWRWRQALKVISRSDKARSKDSDILDGKSGFR